MDAYVIKTDGTIVEVKPKNGRDFQLKEMYELIGCDCIELVYPNPTQVMVVDEEGWLRDNPIVNKKASAIYGVPEAIVGNVLVCKKRMIK